MSKRYYNPHTNEKVKEICNMQDAEKYRLYMQWCNECPKAHNSTCSGADAKKCEQEKKKLLKESE